MNTSVDKEQQPPSIGLPARTWLYGEFEGHFEQVKDKLTIVRGIVRSTKYADQAPTISSQEIYQAHLANAWIEFDSPVEDIKNTSPADQPAEKRIYQAPLSDMVVRHYRLDVIKTAGDVSHGHIKGIIWAKAASTNRPNRLLMFLLLGLSLLMLLLNLLMPPQSMDFRRILSPTLPQADNLQASEGSPADTDGSSGLGGSGDGSGGGSIPFYQFPKLTAGGDALCQESIRISSDVLFDFDSDALKPEAYEELKRLSPYFEVIKHYRLRIVITGYTDSFGDEDYNLDLSKRRAESISQWLIKEDMLTSDQVVTEGRGETHLLVDGSANKKAQAPNRRVELSLACAPNGVPIMLIDYKIDNTPIELPPVVPDAPKPIRIDDALARPELFFNSCGQPLLLSSDVLFDFDRSTLKPDAINELKLIATLLEKAPDPNLQLKIVGHTDAKGNNQHNMRLSYRRAARVAQWLADNTVLTKTQLHIEGRGENQLLTPVTASQEEQGINRRVEILIVCPSGAIDKDLLLQPAINQ